jgi:hypothetical protein
MARRCPICGNPSLTSYSRQSGPNYYECRVCKREWEPEQLFQDSNKPFSHMLWDFVNQDESTRQYKGR